MADPRGRLKRQDPRGRPKRQDPRGRPKEARPKRQDPRGKTQEARPKRPDPRGRPERQTRDLEVDLEVDPIGGGEACIWGFVLGSS